MKVYLAMAHPSQRWKLTTECNSNTAPYIVKMTICKEDVGIVDVEFSDGDMWFGITLDTIDRHTIERTRELLQHVTGGDALASLLRVR